MLILWKLSVTFPPPGPLVSFSVYTTYGGFEEPVATGGTFASGFWLAPIELRILKPQLTSILHLTEQKNKGREAHVPVELLPNPPVVVAGFAAPNPPVPPPPIPPNALPVAGCPNAPVPEPEGWPNAPVLDPKADVVVPPPPNAPKPVAGFAPKAEVPPPPNAPLKVAKVQLALCCLK